MRPISTPELVALVRELKAFEGYRIEKFYELGSDRFRLKIKRRDEGTISLQIILSHTVNKTRYIEQAEAATGFSMGVRNRTEGFLIEKIEQYNNDRIIILRMKKGETESNLIIEMFGKGNLIITDRDMKIQLAYKVHDFKDRSIRPGITYISPKKAVTDANTEESAITESIIYKEGGRSIDYSLGATDKHSGMEMQRYATLQEALDEFYHDNPVETAEKGEKAKKIEELEKSIEKQRSTIKHIEQEAESYKENGAQIMNNMNRLNELISTLKSNKRIEIEELQGRFPDIKVLKIDLKNKTVTISLE